MSVDEKVYELREVTKLSRVEAWVMGVVRKHHESSYEWLTISAIQLRVADYDSSALPTPQAIGLACHKLTQSGKLAVLFRASGEAFYGLASGQPTLPPVPLGRERINLPPARYRQVYSAILAELDKNSTGGLTLFEIHSFLSSQYDMTTGACLDFLKTLRQRNLIDEGTRGTTLVFVITDKGKAKVVSQTEEAPAGS